MQEIKEGILSENYVEIQTTATPYNNKFSGEIPILIYDQGLLFGEDINRLLIPHNHVRVFGNLTTNKYINKSLSNVCSILFIPREGGMVNPPPPQDDCDVPRVDRSRFRGEGPDPLLTFSRSIWKWGKKEGGVI